MYMQWWYGIIANSLFFTSMWALSTKYLSVGYQSKLQIVVLPLVYIINIWYGRSVLIASEHQVSLFVVTLISISSSIILSLIFSKVLLSQTINTQQIIGCALIIGGIVLTQYK